MQQATQARAGRVEVERAQRDEVRRIAVPLQLGDMGETHFVLRDEWKSRFLRKQAEEDMPGLTVRRLRGWMDQPETMGLPRDMQNLVIIGFALQGNYAFALHGCPVERASSGSMTSWNCASNPCRTRRCGRRRRSVWPPPWAWSHRRC